MQLNGLLKWQPMSLLTRLVLPYHDPCSHPHSVPYKIMDIRNYPIANIHPAETTKCGTKPKPHEWIIWHPLCSTVIAPCNNTRVFIHRSSRSQSLQCNRHPHTTAYTNKSAHRHCHQTPTGNLLPNPIMKRDGPKPEDQGKSRNNRLRLHGQPSSHSTYRTTQNRINVSNVATEWHN